MISLRQAKLTDAIPATLGGAAVGAALAYAEWRMRGLLLEYAQDSQIYTALDTCPEMVLDALAVSWKVDWYDTTYPVEIKRSIIRSCMAVRRYMGTAWSAKKHLAMYGRTAALRSGSTTAENRGGSAWCATRQTQPLPRRWK